MKLLKNTYRLWWQKPRKVTDVEEDRSVSFLELFYDLAYVVIVAELVHAFVQDISSTSLLGFVALFSLIWWAWLNGSYYHELHGNYDIRTRVFTFLQMFALAGMAVFAPTAFSTGAQGFAISYSAFLLIIGWLWWRTGVHDSQHKVISQPYTLGFLITAGIFLVSAFSTDHYIYYLWAVGTLLSLLLPFILLKYQLKKDAARLEATQQVRPSFVERFGLLTIIMLGEIVVAVIQGVLHHYGLSQPVILNAVMGLGIAMAMWWIYFDFASHHVPIQRTLPRFSWIYLHLPMTMSIALTGGGILLVLESSGEALQSIEQWLLIGPVALFLFCITLMVQTLDIDVGHTEIHRQGGFGALISAAAVLTLSAFSFTASTLLFSICLLLVFPITLAVRMWIQGLRREHV